MRFGEYTVAKPSWYRHIRSGSPHDASHLPSLRCWGEPERAHCYVANRGKRNALWCVRTYTELFYSD